MLWRAKLRKRLTNRYVDFTTDPKVPFTHPKEHGRTHFHECGRQELCFISILSNRTMKETALPKRQLAILCCVIFSEPVSMLILFPFVYFMVADAHHAIMLCHSKHLGTFRSMTLT
jgi:hypothetical protein